MPTSYPKCSPSEVQGLLVLLNSHAASEDVALLADDLDLEIDEILPAVEFAEVLQMVKVQDGRATLTETGQEIHRCLHPGSQGAPPGSIAAHDPLPDVAPGSRRFPDPNADRRPADPDRLRHGHPRGGRGADDRHLGALCRAVPV